MTSRHVAAGEMQALLEQMQGCCARGERLALATGLVDPKWFRGAQTMVTMAAGDLDQKGLLQPHRPPVEAEVG